MKQLVLVVFLSFLSLSCQRANLRQDIPENCKLLKQVLTIPADTSGGYTLVKGRTKFELDPVSREDITDIKSKTFHFFFPVMVRASLKKQLRMPGYNFSPLVDVLFDINRESMPLEIESDTAAGFYIDKTNMYEKNWDKFYKEHPKIRSITTVSIPAYDKKAGVVLVYKGIWWAPLAANGCVIAFRVSNGKLSEVKRIWIWIS